jgi:hypothetical protein
MSKKAPAEKLTTKKIPIRSIALALGTVVGIAHIGVLGHLLNSIRPQYPVINFPTGKYSSYEIDVTKDGYSVRYKANDPKVLSSERGMNLDKTKNGLFGGGSERRTEYRHDQYTMDGTRNVGGAIDAEGKSARDIECIVADAGARSQGAMAGSSIAAGALVPAVINIPYVGWLAAGWVSLLGGKVGSELGSEVGSVFNDC